jgi:hypothetical protein
MELAEEALASSAVLPGVLAALAMAYAVDPANTAAQDGKFDSISTSRRR